MAFRGLGRVFLMGLDWAGSDDPTIGIVTNDYLHRV